MRQRFMGGALLAAAAVVVGPDTGRAQAPVAAGSPVYQLPVTVRGQIPSAPANTGFDAPLNTEPTIPIPTGKTGDAGFYATAEFVYLSQTRTVGNQTIAFRGLVDSTGGITGLPGTYIGSGQVGLTTRDLGRTTFAPGISTELGYKFEDGSRIYFSYLQMFDSHYSAGATLASPYARSRQDLTDTFLVSGVFNFSPAYAGPAQKTAYDQPGTGASNTYGIWNGASEMTISLVQRFQTAEIGGRVPMFQTDYSRVYGLAGGRYAWFYERFNWRTVSYAVDGNTLPSDAANYNNRLSQHLYGPFIGCGHEVFLANQFSLSLDMTAALLLGTVSERAKYELGDLSTEAKRGVNEWTVVPNANANLNLWWYPIEGVQVRVGYQAMTFFNTRSMSEPVGFNVGAIDPRYDVQYFRLIHGFNVGVGLFF